MKRRNLLLTFLIAISILSLSNPSLGRGVMPTLEALAKDAEIIVVAQIEEVVGEQPENTANASGIRAITWERRVATARVLDIWKGTAGEKVQFRASKSWTCDVSTAVVGETVILFLVDDPKDSVMAIAYSGIGRLPIEDNDGNSRVLLYGPLLSKEIKKLIGIPEDTFRSYVDVTTFKQQVQQIMLNNTARAK
jgi:hypothetical protein